jgi:hypothetical protein
MSTIRGSGDGSVESAEASRRHGPRRPRGSVKKIGTAAAAMPPSAPRRGRPPGSRNKKTVATLAAATAGTTGPATAAAAPVTLSRFWPVLPPVH